MAYISDQDQQKQQTQGGGNSIQPIQDGTTPLVNSGGGIAGSGGGTGGQGASASGPAWTNIQAYMNANQGSTSSADMLNKQVGGGFDQEKANFDSQSQNAKQTGQKQADQSKIGQDQASQLISQMSQADPKSDQFQNYAKQFQGAFQQYQPGQFAYGMGADAQNYGTGLQNDFSGLMNGLYQKTGGGSLTPGALALQQQLDTNNPALNQARTDLLARYSGLQDAETKGTKETNDALGASGDYANQMKANQDSLKQYLGDQKGQSYDQAQRDLFNYHLHGADDGTAAKDVGRYNSILAALGLGGQDISLNDPGVGQSARKGQAVRPAGEMAGQVNAPAPAPAPEKPASSAPPVYGWKNGMGYGWY